MRCATTLRTARTSASSPTSIRKTSPKPLPASSRATTLVLVVSKSFKTPETASNAQLAREWLVEHLGETQANNHLAAVSSAPDKAKAWGAARRSHLPDG